jgi:hypothetical protein
MRATKPARMTGIRILLLGIGMATGLAFLRPGISPSPMPVPAAAAAPVDAPALLSAASPMRMPVLADVRNTNWKALYPAIADTVTLRFADDSSAILSPTGVPILQSTFQLKNDLVIFHDVGGMNACRDMAGSYHVRINGDTLVLVIAEDPCDARAGMMIIKPWVRKR